MATPNYVTPLGSKMSCIHDGNFAEHAAAVSVDAAGVKRLRGYIKRDKVRYPTGCYANARPFDLKTIDRSEWDDRIEYIDRTESSLHHLRRRLKMKSLDQGSTNYCWFNATLNTLRLILAFQQGITPDLSPASGAAPIKNYTNSGGWSGEAIEGLSTDGVCETKFWPPNAISRQYDTPESRENRKLYRVTKWYDLTPTFEQVATCLLLGFPVSAGLDWWSHEVCYMRLLILSQSIRDLNYAAAKQLVKLWNLIGEAKDKYLERSASKYGVDFWNSWSDDYEDEGESTLTESRADPSDAIACEVTTPRPDQAAKSSDALAV